ncbi:TatD family nuclease-associated radical SAM protein [Heliorestis convoluta]|uniref:Radical SAM protein n=1 Tax=Heliorestis convoluta TaxID=356322 RepID=A0A5Q2N6E3_9FIRM|nr:TatD family nuclease-associated radical SAM protein [Heliorestis convoluta]QGG49429.1 radical SAM protein [Heliorestis convoluta]
MITYRIGSSLYLNITNRCTCDCTFCVRNSPAGLSSGYDLWLDQEPTVDEVLQDVKKWDISQLHEFVFCGYGEPMLRTDEVLKICKALKATYPLQVRINTNGHGNLINGYDITPSLKDCVDAISISLNAKNGEDYQSLCKSMYGEKSFQALLDFALQCKSYVTHVIVSVVDILPQKDIEACRKIAEQIGVGFRVRHYGG